MLTCLSDCVDKADPVSITEPASLADEQPLRERAVGSLYQPSGVVQMMGLVAIINYSQLAMLVIELCDEQNRLRPFHKGAFLTSGPVCPVL